MKKSAFVILVAIFALSVTSLGEASQASQTTLEVDITELTTQELMNYQKLKQKEKESSTLMANVTPENINKYAEVGKAFGTAFKECWSTVSDDAAAFAQSPAGKWAMVLVSWKIMGEDAITLTRTVIQWIVGSALLIVGIPVWVWIIRRNCVCRPILFIQRTGFFKKKITYQDRPPLHEDILWGYGVCFGVYLTLAVIVIFIH